MAAAGATAKANGRPAPSKGKGRASASSSSAPAPPASKMQDDFIMTLDSDDEVGDGASDGEKEAEEQAQVLLAQDEDDYRRQREEQQRQQDTALNGGAQNRKGLPARLADREKVVTSGGASASGSSSNKRKASEAAGAGEEQLDPSFTFDLAGDGYSFGRLGAGESASGAWDMTAGGAKAKGSRARAEADANADGAVPFLSVDDLIERRRAKRKARAEAVPLLDEEERDDAQSQQAESSGSDGSESDSEDEEDGFGAGLRASKRSKLDGSQTAADASDDEAADSADSEEGSEGEDDDDEDEEDPLAESDEDDEDDSAQEDEEEDEDSDSSADSDDEPETAAEKARKAAFFASEEEALPSSNAVAEAKALAAAAGKGKGRAGAGDLSASFQALELSRPILRALASLSFHAPTPIQARTIPLALAGKDIVAGAVTGSGKTAAFMIPILERLSHLQGAGGAAAEARSRVLILTPTRELAIQCHSVGRALGKFCSHVRFALCVGGLPLKAQEAELRTQPDVIIATPGRLIDHVRNTPGFTLEHIEVLVMDEADRMLEDGFNDELTEIIRHCPQPTAGSKSGGGRQTMLFSATMTDDVDELVRLSLRKPVRLFVDPKRTTAAKLVQEFVRVRGSGATLAAKRAQEEEKLRPALLLALCTRTFQHQVIIFVRSKKLAHQLRIIFGLLGLRAAELHGDLTQDQRLQALQAFKEGNADFLLATDLASRGLDIRGVQTVINYDMPGQFEQYLHRVGRTARAGRNGRAVTLVGEADRKMLKMALRKSNPDQVKHRLVPTETVTKALETLEKLNPEVEEVLSEEKEEKALRQAEMELKKGTNMQEHADEIFSRPARTWFQSEKEKMQAKETGTALNNAKVKADTDKKAAKDRFAGLSRRKKRAKMMREEVEKEGLNKGFDAAIRAAKRSQKPKELGVLEPKNQPSKKKQKKLDKKKRSSASKVTGGKAKSGFAADIGERRAGGGGRAKASPGKSALKGKGRR